MSDLERLLNNPTEAGVADALRRTFGVPEDMDDELTRLLTLLEDCPPAKRCADNQNHCLSNHGQLTRTS